MLLKCNVTESRIKRGKKHHFHTCPIALAIKGHSEVAHTSVYSEHVVVVLQDGSIYYVDTPKMLRKFIREFDSGKPVEPFAFSLDLPSSTKWTNSLDESYIHLDSVVLNVVE